MAEISFRCKRTVVSSKAVKPGMCHNLSALDLTMEKSILRIVFYYRPHSECAPGEATKKLRERLSGLLTYYPIATGRLQRKEGGGDWVIKCNDAGVRMVEARAGGSVEEWLESADREKELKLIYWENMYHNPYFWSPIYVQITEFEGGGLAIGLSCTHLLADATSATMLIKGWADTTLSLKSLSPPYFHHPPPPLPITPPRTTYNHLIPHYQSALHPTTPDPRNYATITFSFPHDTVEKCISDVATDGSSAPTPFEAIAALLWVCVSRIKGRDKSSLCGMSVCMDTRDVLGLDTSFFGNAMVFGNATISEWDQGGGGVVKRAARAMREVVGKMNSQGVGDLVEWLGSHREDAAYLLNGPQLVCVNWENLLCYKAMFEEGEEPIHVSYYLEPVVGEGQILILPCSMSMGSLSRRAMVTLPEDEVAKLCKEPLLLSYSPKIVMGMKKNYQL